MCIVIYTYIITFFFVIIAKHSLHFQYFNFTIYFYDDYLELVRKLEACLKLNEAYEEQYKLTKAKLEQNPKGKQLYIYICTCL
jgi:hypothetical protein